MTSARWFAVLVLAACEGRPDAPPPGPPTAVAGSLDPKLPYGGELTISAGAGITDDVRHRIETALTAALEPALACMDGIYGTVFAELTLDASGEPARAHVASPLLEGTPIAACIERELAKMQVGKLDGAPVEVRYPVRNMPSQQQMQQAADVIQHAM